MKKSILLIATICLAFAAQAQDTYKILQIHKGTEVTHEVKLSDIDSISFKVVYSYNGHEYVDLGLPSGTLWATCNVGATAPEEYGDFFAWGEVTTKKSYSWGTYKYGTSSSNLTKYNTDESFGTVDNKTVLDPEDDAAHVNWGGDWRMPTLDEMRELLNSEYCTWEWTDDYNGTGVAGRIVTSVSNGNSIFLPAAGYRYGSSLYDAGTCGYYWSSSLYTSYPSGAYFLRFDSDVYDWSYRNRYYGQSVRAVYKK